MFEETEKMLWKDHYSKIILEGDIEYRKYMFGDESIGIPWCAGYAIWYRIIRQFLINTPGITFRKLLEMRPIDIYRISGYELSML